MPLEMRTGSRPGPARHLASPTARIGQWVCSLPKERTAAVQRLATDGVRDLLGCMIAGRTEPAARDAAMVAKAWGTGRASVVGAPQQVPATSAAFANGIASHVLDFDDSYEPMTGHPSASLVPALLAVAEERGLSGADVLDAYVVGLEVIATIGRAMNPSHYSVGWHSTSTLGVIGTSAAMARLFRLPAEGVSAAISNAVSFCSGSRLQLGSAMKSVHAGMAARDGIVAATLSQGGIAGHAEPLTDPRGLVALYGGHGMCDDDFILPGEHDPLSIQAPGLTFKPYPTCGSMHRSLDSLLALRERHGFGPDDVEAVAFIIPALNANNLVHDRPASGLEAKFSMPYCAAVALRYGTVTLSDFTDEAIQRDEVRSLMPRVCMSSLAGSERSDKNYLQWPARTVVRLKSGNVLEDSRFHRQGSSHAPMPASAHRAKFLGCAQSRLDTSHGKALLSLIDGLHAAPDVTPLMFALCAENE